MKRLSVVILLVSIVMLGGTSNASANDECVYYATPLATSARLLAKSISTTAQALVAINKRANDNEIHAFDDIVFNANNKAQEMSQSLYEKQRTILLKAKVTDDYQICKDDISDAMSSLKDETTKAKEMLSDLKKTISDILDQLKGAFFG